MNKRYLVPLETARKLKECGYDEPTKYYYYTDGELGEAVGWVDNSGTATTAPTYDELLDWFDNIGCFITIGVAFKSKMYSCEIRYANGKHKYFLETKSCYDRIGALNEAVLMAIGIITIEQHRNENQK